MSQIGLCFPERLSQISRFHPRVVHVSHETHFNSNDGNWSWRNYMFVRIVAVDTPVLENKATSIHNTDPMSDLLDEL